MGARFRRRRTRLALGQKELAQRAGMARQGIDNIEQGKVERPRRLLELAAALQTTPQWLLYGEGNEETAPPTLNELIDTVRQIDPGDRREAIERLRSLLPTRRNIA